MDQTIVADAPQGKTAEKRPHCAMCQSGNTVTQPGGWVICKKCGFRRRKAD